MSQVTPTLLVDCQVFQTTAWSRGMGRYLLSLLHGIHQSDQFTKTILICNKNLDLSSDKQSLIKSVLPDAEIKMLDFAQGLSDEVEKKNTATLDLFIDKEGFDKSTVFLMASVFSFDYQPAFPSKTINTTLFYDMIPLKDWSTFHRYFPEAEYLKRYKFFYKSDKIYAISEAVKSDLINVLGFKASDVVNIDGAEIPNFAEAPVLADADDAKNDKPRPYRYILLPGGNSPHKNMLRAIRAFDIYNAKHGDCFRLLITSFYSEHNRQAMTELSPNIELCGEVSDDELSELFKHAELILFPSIDEGLGLPVLEAVGYNKRVACSSIPVFKEISKTAFTFFNPLDVNDMASAISKASLTNLEDAKYVKEYQRIKAKFTWERSAEILLDSIKTLRPYEPASTKKSLSVCIEQTGNMEDVKTVAPFVREHYRNGGIQLFIDEIFEQLRSPESVPLIFHYFLKHRDIADLPHKSRGTSVVTVLTSRSSISIALALNADRVILSGLRSVSKLKDNLTEYCPDIPNDQSEELLTVLESNLSRD